MVTYPLNELQPGMIVAADVFTPRGQLIVLRGSILKSADDPAHEILPCTVRYDPAK